MIAIKERIVGPRHCYFLFHASFTLFETPDWNKRPECVKCERDQ
jgi:hypothetical protein